MSYKFLPISRGTLIKLRSQLKLMKRGKEVLEMRREQLIREITNLLMVIKKRPEVEHRLINEIHEISRVRLIRGEVEFTSLVSLVKRPIIEILPYSIQGVPVPQVKIVSDPDLSNLKDPELKRLANNFWEIMKELIEIANAEIAIEKLANYLNYINRIVNSLEKNLIPQLEKLIKYVEERVEEESLEEFIRLKKIKGE